MVLLGHVAEREQLGEDGGERGAVGREHEELLVLGEDGREQRALQHRRDEARHLCLYAYMHI